MAPTVVPSSESATLPTGWRLMEEQSPAPTKRNPDKVKTLYYARNERAGLSTTMHADIGTVEANADRMEEQRQRDEVKAEQTALLRRVDHLYDAEADELVLSTPERRQRAGELHVELRDSVLRTARAVAEIRDERLYLEMGFETWSLFCEHAMSASRQQVNRIAEVGRAFGHLVNRAPVHGQIGEAEERNTGVPSETLDISGLGLRKLYALSRLDEPEREALAAGQSVTTAEGATFSIEEIKGWGAREVEAKTRELLGAFKSRIQTEVAAREAAEAAKDAGADAARVAEQKILEARTLEHVYGGLAHAIEGKYARLDTAVRLLDQARAAVTNAAVEHDDPEALRARAVEVWHRVLRTAEDIQTTLAAVLAVTDDAGNRPSDAFDLPGLG